MNQNPSLPPPMEASNAAAARLLGTMDADYALAYTPGMILQYITGGKYTVDHVSPEGLVTMTSGHQFRAGDLTSRATPSNDTLTPEEHALNERLRPSWRAVSIARGHIRIEDNQVVLTDKGRLDGLDPDDPRLAEPARPTDPEPPAQRLAGVVVAHSAVQRRVEVTGVDRGDRETQTVLKAAGFRWSRRSRLWRLPERLSDADRAARIAQVLQEMPDLQVRDMDWLVAVHDSTRTMIDAVLDEDVAAIDALTQAGFEVRADGSWQLPEGLDVDTRRARVKSVDEVLGGRVSWMPTDESAGVAPTAATIARPEHLEKADVAARKAAGIDFAGIRGNHPIVEVLARMGIDPPAGWDGARPFRVGASALGLPHGRDDSQGVLIKPDTPGHSWYAFHAETGGDVLELVRLVTGAETLRAAAGILEEGGPIVVDRAGGSAERVQARAAVYEEPNLTRTPTARVLEVNAAAWGYYTYAKLAERATAYLAGRGIDVTALQREAKQPLAGHTPASPTGLVDQLSKRGFTADELVDAGWAARTNSGEIRDRFRGRVLLPFKDEAGNVLGVAGRAVNWSDGDRAPKYLNTPLTAVFDKSKVLYRPTEHQLAPQASVIAVEGTLDALAIASTAATAGLSAHFAPCSQSGISLTDHVAPRFYGLSSRPPIVCGDADPAGQAATARWAISAMTKQHREVLTVTLPNGSDPADWLREHGPDGLLAFSTVGCLTDEAHLRPRPAGYVVADQLTRATLGNNPDMIEAHASVNGILNKLNEIATGMNDPAALRRFAQHAGQAIANHVDGRGAGWYAARLEVDEHLPELDTRMPDRAASADPRPQPTP